MHEEYDVLAVRAQRAEAAGSEPFAFRVGDKRYTWPAELPAGALELVGSMQEVTDDASPAAAAAMSALLRALSGDDADELGRLLSIQDLAALLPTYIEKITGSRLGESPASGASSPGTRKPRKQTSKPRTA